MIFITMSGSRYEADLQNKKIRRLSGANQPTLRQGKDGDWREFDSISSIEINKEVLIIWTPNTKLLEGSPRSSIPATMTSKVKEICDEENKSDSVSTDLC